MDLIKNLLKENKEKIVDAIFDDELKGKIVKKLNYNIDIPFISEKTEEKYLIAIYESVEDVVKAQLLAKL